MSTYTVHEPPMEADEGSSDPVRFVFVRDGFSFWAFLLTGLWMAWHRLWLVLIGYMAVATTLAGVAYWVGSSASVTFGIAALLSLLVGFEAATLRRFTLTRRGWKTAGIVVGDDVEAAERRFFDIWVRGDSNSSPAPAVTLARRAPELSGVIGLFPEPGAHR
jgi:Protein of unknown function (DUF2628)